MTEPILSRDERLRRDLEDLAANFDPRTEGGRFWTGTARMAAQRIERLSTALTRIADGCAINANILSITGWMSREGAAEVARAALQTEMLLEPSRAIDVGCGECGSHPAGRYCICACHNS